MRRIIVLGLIISLTDGLMLTAKADKDGETGAISGTIRPPGQAVSIIALSQGERKKYKGMINDQTGEYLIKGLPEGTYDLMLKAKRHIIEGIQFCPGNREEEVEAEDKEEIQTRINSVEPFFNRKKILRVAGGGKCIDVLVEQVRDKIYYLNPTGETVTNKVIRRIDLWRFQKSGLCWVWIKKKHLYREEISASENGRDLRHKFEKKFTGIEVLPGGENKGHDYNITSEHELKQENSLRSFPSQGFPLGRPPNGGLLPLKGGPDCPP